MKKFAFCSFSETHIKNELADLKNEISLAIITELLSCSREDGWGNIKQNAADRLIISGWGWASPLGNRKTWMCFKWVQTASETTEHFHQ